MHDLPSAIIGLLMMMWTPTMSGSFCDFRNDAMNAETISPGNTALTACCQPATPPEATGCSGPGWERAGVLSSS